MSYFLRLLSIPAIVLTLALSAGCGPAMVSVGVDDGYSYGQRRLPLSYFYYDDYYDGMWNQDYVCYGDSWYYHGYDTPYYYDDPYYW